MEVSEKIKTPANTPLLSNNKINIIIFPSFNAVVTTLAYRKIRFSWELFMLCFVYNRHHHY